MSSGGGTKSPQHLEIEALEQQEADAMLRADLAALESFWSDDLIVNSTANIIAGKALLLDLIRSRRLLLKSYQRRTLRLASNGDLVLTTGNESSRLAVGTITDQLLCSYMNIWRKQQGRWQLIARHVGLISRTP
jgi:ketosteroid isomerase-like protein